MKLTEYTDNSGNYICCEQLLPCPFCGTDPILEFQGNNYTKSRKVHIKCPKCRIKRTDAALTHSTEWLVKVATDEWNKRV